MKDLLRLMLVHYYQDSKRSTNAAITRKLDRDITSLIQNDIDLSHLVQACKRKAEALKRQDRTAKSKSRTPHMHHGNPHVRYVPCRERRK